MTEFWLCVPSYLIASFTAFLVSDHINTFQIRANAPYSVLACLHALFSVHLRVKANPVAMTYPSL